jgi:L-alanine-DL-glutamate epimerase-like enolase superfamily enzyme
VMAHHNMPMVEHFPNHGRDGDTFTGELVAGGPIFEGGYVTVPSTPGLGVSLDTDAFREHAIPQ